MNAACRWPGRHCIVGPDHMAHMLPQMFPAMLPYGLPGGLRRLAGTLAESLLPRFIAGQKAVEGAGPLPYDIEHVQVKYVRDDPGIPVGFWRSVAHSQNAFVVESFLDEIAAATNRDPVDLRLELLRNNPSLRRGVGVGGGKKRVGAIR